MTRPLAIFGYCLRSTALRLAPLLALAMALTWCGLWSRPPIAGAGAEAAAAAGLWLHLSTSLLALGAVASVLEAWPLFSRDRAGAPAVARLSTAGIDGCLPAAIGALCALAVALGAGALVFVGMLAALGFSPGDVRAHVPFRAESEMSLLKADERLVLHAEGAGTMSALTLRPQAMWGPQGYSPTRLRVTADGEPLHDGWLVVRGSHRQLKLSFPARPLSSIEVATDPDAGLVLRFGPGRVEGILIGAKSGLLNALLAAACYLIPAAFALATACLMRRLLALPVGVALAATMVVLAALFDWLPNGVALAAYAEGRWLPAENLLGKVADSLCIVAAPTIAAVFTTGRRRP